ncbi:sensor histidine kinase [Granulicella aggregans]|uniref:sensor histidine kinase n=1 Tax=Granulicella aggregans TaxID=474949 RepID=UPI0021DFAEB9|nr:ATP-binding protein [Granulicella aggregans]
MRLKTKLVLAATVVTLIVVLLLTGLFIAELLRQRIEQTATSNEALASQVRSTVRHALEIGLARDLSTPASEEELMKSVSNVLRSDETLQAQMGAILRTSLTVQDVSVTDSHGIVLASTDPDAVDQPAAGRISLETVAARGLIYQWRQVFGTPRVFDLGSALNRNGQPFLIVHIGVRSTFIRASFAPGLRDALLFAVPATLLLVLGAGVLTNIALRPLETVNAQLELLTVGAEEDGPQPVDGAFDQPDTVVRVAKTIDRLERKMRSKETRYTALQANMEQMLDTLRDGVLLLAPDHATGELRSVMVSDAVALFLRAPGEEGPPKRHGDLVGRRVEEIFPPDTALGTAVVAALEHDGTTPEFAVLDDGRQVQISLDRIPDGNTSGADIGIMLTLRDIDSAMQLEQELEVSRRLAAIGRITAGVGHEVKNPINAMVLHLELLRGKLAANGDSGESAQRHVNILVSEMQRLDRVVQTLADFSRPMELRLRVIDLRDVIAAVIDLTWEQMKDNNVTVKAEAVRGPLLVHVDSDLIRQAILNLVLNGMQAMPDGGVVTIMLRRENQSAVIEVRDRGTGIEAELLPRIFELYFTTKKTGSGIGLAMTYRILQMHGGTLAVRSTTDAQAEDRGSVFTLTLPISSPGSNMRLDTSTQNNFALRGTRA